MSCVHNDGDLTLSLPGAFGGTLTVRVPLLPELQATFWLMSDDDIVDRFIRPAIANMRSATGALEGARQ